MNARVFYPTADRFGGGFGLVAEWTPVWAKRSLSLRGSLDTERTFLGAGTSVLVSGERLISEAAKNSLLLGLSGTYRQGRFALGVETSAGAALGSGLMEYSGFLHFGVRF